MNESEHRTSRRAFLAEGAAAGALTLGAESQKLYTAATALAKAADAATRA